MDFLKQKSNKKIYILLAVIMFVAVFFSHILFIGLDTLMVEAGQNIATVTPLTLTGLGTYLSPYKISNGIDLANLCAYTNTGGVTKGLFFKLMADDLTKDSSFQIALLEPIGTLANPFMGVFDGNNLTLTGTNFVTNSLGQAGVFGQVKNATIKNLTVEYNKLPTTATMMGGIVASAYSSNIINCHNKTEIFNNSGNAMVAGIVGYAYNTYISNCSNNANITVQSSGEAIAAGISACDFNTSIVLCANFNTVTADGNGSSYAGGLSGKSSTASAISQNFNYTNATIKATTTSTTYSSYAGGITAYGGEITDCFNRASISAVAPETSGTDTPTSDNMIHKYIKSSSTLGLKEVSLKSDSTKDEYKKVSAYAGGISGYNEGKIKNCYNTGGISGGGITCNINNTTRYYYYYVSYSGKYRDKKLNHSKKYTFVYSTISFTKEKYASNINGYLGADRVDCYSTKAKSVAYCNYNLEDYSYSSVKRYSSKTYKNTDISARRTIVNASNKGVGEYKENTVNHPSTTYIFNDSYAMVKFATNSLSLIIGSTVSVKDINGKITKTEPSSITAYVVPISVTDKYTYTTTIKSSKYTGTDKTLPRGFSSSNWAYSSVINDGYPHLKCYYWQDKAAA